MRLLILGADGMLGHQLVASLRARHDVAGTVRQPRTAYAHLAAALPDVLYDGVDVRDSAALARTLEATRPDAVINAVGIVKQRVESKHAIDSIEVNALLPHRLALACAARDARLIHFSTDCVFSGRRGAYREGDLPDADDLYGLSKRLGEVTDAGCLTLRTSIIGLELGRHASLVEWFLAQRGPIRGYTRAIWSGVTTLEMARVVEHVLTHHPRAHGLYHVAGTPVDKHSLLCRLRDRLGRTLAIEPDATFECDRSLVAERFQADFGYVPRTWESMVDELAMQIEERGA